MDRKVELESILSPFGIVPVQPGGTYTPSWLGVDVLYAWSSKRL